MFLVYINDLTSVDIDGSFQPFADDTTESRHGYDVEKFRSCISADIKRIKDWCDANRFVFNAGQTMHLVVMSIWTVELFELLKCQNFWVLRLIILKSISRNWLENECLLNILLMTRTVFINRGSSTKKLQNQLFVLQGRLFALWLISTKRCHVGNNL